MRLRPLGIALLLLVVLDLGLRLLLPPDRRVLRDPLHPYGCYHEDELSRLEEARRRGSSKGALDLVLLGDSVLSSVNNAPGEHVEDFLGGELRRRLPSRLRGREVRLWNLGRGGSRPADLYGAFLELEPLLGTGRPPDLLVVMNSNIIFFSRRHALPAMLYPCLAERFAAERDLLSLLKVPAGPGPVERWLVEQVTRGFYLYQQRRRLDEWLFGGPPRQVLLEHFLGLRSRLRSRLPAPPRAGTGGAAEERNLPWDQRHLERAQFAASYDLQPPADRRTPNWEPLRRLARALARHPRQAFVFLTPQNHGLIGPLGETPVYRETAQAIAAAFAGAGVPFRSYDGDALVEDRLFTDLDHLNADGNRRLAELLAADLARLLGDAADGG